MVDIYKNLILLIIIFLPECIVSVLNMLYDSNTHDWV